MNATQELEAEYKALISKKMYKKLSEYLKVIATAQPVYQQINYFFDTTDLELNKKKLTLRIRKKLGQWELTLKVPVKTPFSRCTTKEEYNFPISDEQAITYLQSGIHANDQRIRVILKSLNIDDQSVFSCLGSLKTERTEFLFYSDIICLDHNWYNDVEDYEIEWETSNHPFVEEAFRKLDLSSLPSNGKRSRFLKTLDKRQVHKVVIGTVGQQKKT